MGGASSLLSGASILASPGSTACGESPVSAASGQFSRWERGARLTRRVRQEYRAYSDGNATTSTAKRGGSGGMHRRSNAACVLLQAVGTGSRLPVRISQRNPSLTAERGALICRCPAGFPQSAFRVRSSRARLQGPGFRAHLHPSPSFLTEPERDTFHGSPRSPVRGPTVRERRPVLAVAASRPARAGRRPAHVVTASALAAHSPDTVSRSTARSPARRAPAGMAALRIGVAGADCQPGASRAGGVPDTIRGAPTVEVVR